MNLAKTHRPNLWIAGMADIHKYQTERGASRLTLQQSEPRRLIFRLTCRTDAELYDQPLTLEITGAPSLGAGRFHVTDAKGRAIPLRTSLLQGASVLLCDVPPRDSSYSLELNPRS